MEKELTAEDLQVYDRQRFIGIDVQRRYLNCLIFKTHKLQGINSSFERNNV